jgi:hypothetical protein
LGRETYRRFVSAVFAGRVCGALFGTWFDPNRDQSTKGEKMKSWKIERESREFKFDDYRIRFAFLWFDLWIGAFWDQKSKTLYVCPIPCFVISIRRVKVVMTTETIFDPAVRSGIKLNTKEIDVQSLKFLSDIEPEILKRINNEFRRQMDDYHQNRINKILFGDPDAPTIDPPIMPPKSSRIAFVGRSKNWTNQTPILTTDAMIDDLDDDDRITGERIERPVVGRGWKVIDESSEMTAEKFRAMLDRVDNLLQRPAAPELFDRTWKRKDFYPAHLKRESPPVATGKLINSIKGRKYAKKRKTKKLDRNTRSDQSFRHADRRRRNRNQ